MARDAMNMRILPLALFAAACSPVAVAPTRPPLEGAKIGGPFALVDQDGRPRTDRDFAGRWRIMYFGYTFCPDVCPTEMQTIAAGLKAFADGHPDQARRVVPIFVTVDPRRDTPAVLKQFVSAFGPNMVGLTGTPAEIDRVADAYKIFHAIGAAQPGGGYLVDHSNQAYLFDPAGKPIALLPADAKGSPRAVADELAKWVR